MSVASKEFLRQNERLRRTVGDLRKALPADAALVDLLEYTHVAALTEKGGQFTSRRRFVAFVVRAKSPAVQIDLGPSEPIAAAIEAWRMNFGGLKNPGQCGSRPNAARIGLGQIGSRASRRKDRSPLARRSHGAVPLAGAAGPKARDIFVGRNRDRNSAVPRLLIDLPTTAVAGAERKEPSLLLVGDVDFDADPGTPPPGPVAQAAVAQAVVATSRGGETPHWPSLPGSRTEIAAIADSFEQQFPDGQLKKLRGVGATKSAVAEELSRRRFVHLATHGFFAPPRSPAGAGRGLRTITAGATCAARVERRPAGAPLRPGARRREPPAGLRGHRGKPGRWHPNRA